MNQSTAPIRKAIIPAAGFGTRLFPATKALKKELLPIIDRDGRVKPTILAIVEEAISAGIEEVALIVQSGDSAFFENFFKTPLTDIHYNKLSPENQAYSQYLQALGQKITLLTQESQEGYGHAVFCAKDWVNDEPFLLFLGDHVYLSDTDQSCASQLVEVYNRVGKSTVALTVTPATEIYHCGCVTGNWQDNDGILSLTQVCEKPDLDYARKNLIVEGLTGDRFLTVFGIYALTPTIFDFLEANIRNNLREKGEFQLTTCLEQVREAEGMYGYQIKGRCFDTGMPDAYYQTFIDFREFNRPKP
ncbi:UTP--glucose-1-phosphate uridylyltransferase [Oscillatoria acuminata]|uniref:UTP--glucose-1-phosphate uridylyltransferase n=1 Tax=Oscillatoria acuminata PCC 6304 TaxID=56110 RepID=K9TGL0_9CYAN|nr:UTP--glucose-1-phosphate uridylyltransferase [Oscillatoria acuminata]AFY81538.1 UDP-glucose pyrophosphorylase [Oscillatoria acuminata PCC 6304]